MQPDLYKHVTNPQTRLRSALKAQPGIFSLYFALGVYSRFHLTAINIPEMANGIAMEQQLFKAASVVDTSSPNASGQASDYAATPQGVEYRSLTGFGK
jgi:hypothetical protein